jgi:hypothetical protein
MIAMSIKLLNERAEESLEISETLKFEMMCKPEIGEVSFSLMDDEVAGYNDKKGFFNDTKNSEAVKATNLAGVKISAKTSSQLSDY